MAIRIGAMVAAAWSVVGNCHAAEPRDALSRSVDEAIQPLMARDGIAGLAGGVISAGRHRVFDYGFTSLAPKRPVTEGTLFEVGYEPPWADDQFWVFAF